MPFPVGMLKRYRDVATLAADKLDALSRAVSRKRRCKACFYFDPGDGSQPGAGICTEDKPQPVVFTQAMWADGPQTKDNWAGLKNQIKFLQPETGADRTCRHFTRHRLIAGMWGRS